MKVSKFEKKLFDQPVFDGPGESKQPTIVLTKEDFNDPYTDPNDDNGNVISFEDLIKLQKQDPEADDTPNEKQLPSSPKEIGEQALKEGETSSKSITGPTGTEIGVGNENLNPVKTQVEKSLVPACKAPKENIVTEDVYPKKALIILCSLVSVLFIVLIIIGIIGLIFVL